MFLLFHAAEKEIEVLIYGKHNAKKNVSGVFSKNDSQKNNICTHSEHINFKNAFIKLIKTNSWRL